MLTLLGALVAGLAAHLRNEGIEPLWRAEAPVVLVENAAELLEAEGQAQIALQTQLEDALARANEATAEFLVADPSAEIISDPSLARITFVARGPSPDAAQDAAAEMRRLFLVRPEVDFDEQLEEQQAAILEQMTGVRGEIEALDAANPTTPEMQLRLDQEALLASLRSRQLALDEELLIPGERTRSEIDAELVEVRLGIEDVLVRLDELPSLRGEFSDYLTQRRALERQFRELEVRFQDLLIQRGDFQDAPQTELIEPFDETPTNVSRRLAVVVGTVAGMALAVAAVLITERMVRPVWLPTDVRRIPLLASSPVRRPLGSGVWYDQPGTNRRKAAIQALRAGIRGRASEGRLVLAVVGDRVSSADVHMLAADLAAGFAGSGSRTLLVDADLEHSSGLAEFSKAGFGLSDLLTLPGNPEEVRQWTGAKLAAAEPVRPGLLSVATGTDAGDPADALANPRLGLLFEWVGEAFDTAVVVGGDFDDPSTQELLRWTDFALLTLMPGRSPQAALSGSLEELAQRNVDFLGAVMLRRPVPAAVERLIGWFDKLFQPGNRPAPAAASLQPDRSFDELLTLGADETEADEEDRGIRRWGNGAGRGEPPAGSGAGQPSPAILAGVRTARNSGEHAEPMVGELVRRLDEAEPAEAYPVVARFLTERVTQMLTASEGVTGSLSEATVHAVTGTGFIPLWASKGRPSVGGLVRHELRETFGPQAGIDLEARLMNILAEGAPEHPANLDQWLAAHFFVRHVEATERAPVVWHLRSKAGVVEVLIAAERLTPERIDLLVDSCVRLEVEQLERQLRSTRRAEEDSLSRLEEQVREARTFEISLGLLRYGSTASARIWYPWQDAASQPKGWEPRWEEGIRPNLAPLQRLGLLPLAVLSDAELAELEPPV